MQNIKTTRDLIEWCSSTERSTLDAVDTMLDNLQTDDPAFNELMNDVNEILADLDDLEKHIKSTLIIK
jgi:ABC-type transporter Mla subunit MlaD